MLAILQDGACKQWSFWRLVASPMLRINDRPMMIARNTTKQRSNSKRRNISNEESIGWY